MQRELKTADGPSGAQNGNPGEGKIPEKDHAEGSRMTLKMEGTTVNRTALDSRHGGH